MIGVIFRFLSVWFARLLGSTAIRWVAMKAVVWTLVITVLPTVLYILQAKILSEYLSAASEGAVSGAQPMHVSLTGFLGWFAVQLRIPEAFSILLSAVLFRLTFALAFSAVKK